MKPRHDIPGGRRPRRSPLDGRARDHFELTRTRTKVLTRIAEQTMEQVLREGRLKPIDRVEMTRLRERVKLAEAMRDAKVAGQVQQELTRFIKQLANRLDGSSRGESGMPAPVFPRGNPPSLSGAAEAPLD